MTRPGTLTPIDGPRRSGGLARIEVRAPASDAPLLRTLAARLRPSAPRSEDLRERLKALMDERPVTVGLSAPSVLDMFASDLPDAVFESIFETRLRADLPRDIDL
jgi:hypothetical protein